MYITAWVHNPAQGLHLSCVDACCNALERRDRLGYLYTYMCPLHYVNASDQKQIKREGLASINLANQPSRSSSDSYLCTIHYL